MYGKLRVTVRVRVRQLTGYVFHTYKIRINTYYGVPGQISLKPTISKPKSFLKNSKGIMGPFD